MEKRMINVIGLGYIGLPTALILASKRCEVIGTDSNKDLVRKLNKGQITFEEKGLDIFFEAAVAGNIKFTTECVEADAYIVAVPTPYDKKNKKINPSYVIQAAKSVLKCCKEDSIIIIESTISPKTIDTYIRPLVHCHNKEEGTEVQLAHAPERIIPGNMIYELEHNPRTIGVDNEETGRKIRDIYSCFCQGEIILTDIRTAEMTKVVENTYRDINIAFANELAKICRFDDMDVYEIIRIANKHPRVNILNPGPGVGGHCISVDPWFLVGDYPGLANIILAARKINDSMPEFVLKRMSVIMEEHGIHDLSRVGLYGLTYKEDVDDIRESPALQLLDCMKKHLANGIRTYDPFIKHRVVKGQMFDFNDFLDAVDFVVIMVSHQEIMGSMDKIAEKIVLDTKNICSFHAYHL